MPQSAYKMPAKADHDHEDANEDDREQMAQDWKSSTFTAQCKLQTERLKSNPNLKPLDKTKNILSKNLDDAPDFAYQSPSKHRNEKESQFYSH